MALDQQKREIPRAWEVDWASPPNEGGVPWAALRWLLDIADELGSAEVTLVAHTYEQLGNLGWAIGHGRAGSLRVGPHQFELRGITVHGSTFRGRPTLRGPVLVAWATDETLSIVEGMYPTAVAAVATWPDDISGWRSVHAPGRIGEIRDEQEAEYDTVPVPVLNPRAVDLLRSASAMVNENHSVLSRHEREAMAGAFVALRRERVEVDASALRAHLMAAGWNGALIGRVIGLAEQVERGKTPRHRH